MKMYKWTNRVGPEHYALKLEVKYDLGGKDTPRGIYLNVGPAVTAEELEKIMLLSEDSTKDTRILLEELPTRNQKKVDDWGKKIENISDDILNYHLSGDKQILESILKN